MITNILLFVCGTDLPCFFVLAQKSNKKSQGGQNLACIAPLTLGAAADGSARLSAFSTARHCGSCCLQRDVRLLLKKAAIAALASGRSPTKGAIAP